MQRSMKDGAIVFASSAEIDHEHSERLQELLDIEKHNRILLDRKDGDCTEYGSFTN